MIIRNFPELRQFSNYDCGPLSIEAILIYFNYNYTEAEISKIAGSNEEIGTTPEGMEKAARHFNLAYESGEMTVKKLKNNIRKIYPQ